MDARNRTGLTIGPEHMCGAMPAWIGGAANSMPCALVDSHQRMQQD